MDKAREAAVKIINEVHEKGAYANVALVQELRRQELSDVDRRFVTELVYGTVKAGATLDWILRRYVNRPVKKIPPMIADILRLGLYQLFFMDRIPASAACNEAVELAKRYGHPGTVKFVNAVLRTAVREPDKAAFPEGKGQATTQLALASQHPEWLVRRWIREFGYAEAAALCAFDNEQAVLSLRTNTLKISREDLLTRLQDEGAEGEASAWAPEGIRCLSHGALDRLPSLQQGLFQVQDESSMQVAHVVAPQPGEFIIDTCSAPGGKTTHLAAIMENTGRILALDIYEHKLQRVAENAARLGISIIETKLLDAREVGELYAGQAYWSTVPVRSCGKRTRLLSRLFSRHSRIFSWRRRDTSCRGNHGRMLWYSCFRSAMGRMAFSSPGCGERNRVWKIYLDWICHRCRQR